MATDELNLNSVFEQLFDLLALPRILSAKEEGFDTGVGEETEELLGQIKTVVDGWKPADYETSFGARQASIAAVPWLGIFPPEQMAQRGIYLVYLFAADGSAAYLSLNQGTEDVNGGLAVIARFRRTGHGSLS